MPMIEVTTSEGVLNDKSRAGVAGRINTLADMKTALRPPKPASA